MRSLNLKPIGADLLAPDCQCPTKSPKARATLSQPQLGLGLVAGAYCLPVPPGAAAPHWQVPGTASASGTQPGIAWSCRNRSTSLTSQSRFSRPVQQLQLDQSHKLNLKRTVAPGLVTPRLPPIGFAQSLRGRRMIARCRAWEAMIAQEARCRAWEARGHAGEGGGRYEEAHRCRRRTTSCTC